MAREFVERKAYDVLEEADMSSQSQRHVFHRAHSAAAAVSHSAYLSKSNSCVDGEFGNSESGGVPVYVHGQEGRVCHEERNRRLHQSKSSINFHQHSSSEQYVDGHDGDIARDQGYGLMQHMKKRLSDNVEHYSNMFHQMALPLILRKGKNARSRSQSREGRRSHSQGRAAAAQNRKSYHEGTNGERHSDEEEYVFVEHIELQQMDGFSWTGQPEAGKGHDFKQVQLKNSTWCDKCGDFIWGIYKQCLVCKSKYFTFCNVFVDLAVIL